MIERFNFFDLYGYLIPGVVALALAVVPGAAVVGLRLSDIAPDGLDVIPMLIVAYVVGIVTQRVAHVALPSTIHRNRDEREGAQPSEILLDRDDGLLPSEKDELLLHAKRANWVPEVRLWSDVEKKRRQVVFLNCRAQLVAGGRARYAEQFQGMYTMCRGLALLMLLCWPVFVTWSVPGLRFSLGQCDVVVAAGVLVLLPLIAVSRLHGKLLQTRGLAETRDGKKRHLPVPRMFWIASAIGGAATGHLLRVYAPLEPVASVAVLLLGTGLLAGGILLRIAHIDLATDFARTVYREFLVAVSSERAQQSGSATGDSAHAPDETA